LRSGVEFRLNDGKTPESAVSADPHGLLSLLEQYGAELHALLTRLTLRAGVAEDLLQELFLKLRHNEGMAQATNPRAYLFRTAMNLAFDWRRSQRPTEPLDHEPVARTQAPIDLLIDAEDWEQILDALPQVSELSRQALVLRYLQRQDYAEIATQLDRTEHQVRGLCARGLEQLRSLLRPPSRPHEQREIRS
jgi:RNA polymerase sigma-70 factor (ECF subfamily)